MEDLNRKLTWLMATRLMVVLSVVFGSLIYSPGALADHVPLTPWFEQLARFLPLDILQDDSVARGSASEQSQVMQFLVGATSLLTLVYAGLLRLLSHRPRRHVVCQLAGDLIMITLLIYKFGGGTAILSVLYFVIVAVAAFMLRGRAAFVTAGCAYILYSLVLVSHQSEAFRTLWEPGKAFSILPPLERVTGSPADLSLTEEILIWLHPPRLETVTGVPVSYNLLVHLFGFITVAYYTTYLASNPELERELEAQSQNLASLRTFHRDVVQSISSGLLVADLDGITQSLNRSGEQILGLSEGLLKGRHVSETGLFSEPKWQKLAEASNRGLLRSETTIDRSADLLHIGFTLSPLRDGDGAQRGFILIFQDLTEWRELQEHVRLQDRMAALGQMAAGLAHEVGNPLAAISGSTQMLAGRLEVSPADAKLLEITIKESQRLDRTVKSFLQFAKPRDRHPESFDIVALLSGDAALLRNSSDVRDEHQIVLDFVPSSTDLVADVDQVGQLFWNLARNAIQAMPQGGTLTVRGRVVDDEYRLQVSDTGRGMTEDEKSKLFQPFKSFFDGGLGLGMAICYRIVEEHGGWIRVDSEPQKGTTIHVALPLEGVEELSSQEWSSKDSAPALPEDVWPKEVTD
jgi:two-component system sensor histidine kinase PilS (NtrC family)